MTRPVSFYSETHNDNTINQKTGQPESSNFEVAITELTAANVVAKTALMGALSTAIDDITIGRLAKTDTVFSRETISSLPAATTLAQRENKWLVRYVDSVDGTKFRVSLPCADLTELPDNSEYLDISAGNGAAFKTAFEAIVVSPNDGAHSVTVTSVQFVGRNT